MEAGAQARRVTPAKHAPHALQTQTEEWEGDGAIGAAKDERNNEKPLRMIYRHKPGGGRGGARQGASR